MKSLQYSLQILIASSLLAHSQVETSPLSRESQVATSSPAAPRILGEIPDGTPLPPAPPKPAYRVAAQDVLSTATYQRDGRTISIRQIKPIDIAQQSAPVESPAAETTGEPVLPLADQQVEYSRSGLLALSATVFRAKNSAPRTLVRIWPTSGRKEIVFWSSADFALIADGINSFVDADGETHHLLMACGSADTATLAELQTSGKTDDDLSRIPDFQEGKATFRIVGELHDTKELVPIRALHDLYNSEYARLKTALEGRERARTEREEFLKANPPQPKNITLNFWRIDSPAVKGKGESK